MTPFLILATVLVVLCLFQTQFVLSRRKLQSSTWDELLSKIQPVDFNQLQRVARAYLEPGKDQLQIQPAEMWQILGEQEGLARVRHNAGIMLDLAVYAERWNFHEGRIIAEIMRRDAVRLRDAAKAIESSLNRETRTAHLPFHLQEVCSAYYLMRQRLMALYENSHVGRLPQLQAAL